MNKLRIRLTLFITGLLVFGGLATKAQQNRYYVEDTPYIQEFSIKYDFENPRVELQKVASDRNGYIQILSSYGHARTGFFP